MATRQQVIDILEKVLIPAYPRQTIGPATIDVYVQALQDIDAAILRAASIECITHDDGGKGDWFPSVARIRRYAAEITTGKAAKMTASDAWGMVTTRLSFPERILMPSYQYEEARERYPWLLAYEPEEDGIHVRLCKLPDEVEAAVASIGGWAYLRRETDNLVADRARFIEAYNTTERREQQRAEMAPGVREMVDKIIEQRRIAAPERPALEGGA